MRENEVSLLKRLRQEPRMYVGFMLLGGGWNGAIGRLIAGKQVKAVNSYWQPIKGARPVTAAVR